MPHWSWSAADCSAAAEEGKARIPRQMGYTATAMSSLRLFIAVPTPAEVRARLQEVTAELRRAEADVRWEPTEKMHATVKFLGDTPPDRVESLCHALDRVAGSFAPLEVVVSGIGAFPSLRSPRVLWVGMEDPSGGLGRLQQAIEDALSPLGFAREDRAFHPHVTLGRVRGQRNMARLLGIVESLTLERQPVQLHDVLLVKSELKPHGSVYRTLRSASLVGNQTHHG